jgi:hypothetical protein
MYKSTLIVRTAQQSQDKRGRGTQKMPYNPHLLPFHPRQGQRGRVGKILTIEDIGGRKDFGISIQHLFAE